MIYNQTMENLVTVKSKFMMNLFDQNTYVLSNKKEAIIIDAGAELEDVLEAVENKKVLGVLMTHLHFDHFWNIDEYLDKFDCPVYVVHGFENKFEKPELNCSPIVKKEIVKNVKKEQIKYYENHLKIGSFDIDVFFTPGHSADCVCLLVGDKLFSGDTVFVDGVGRTDLYDSDNNQMADSLEKIKEIKYSEIYPGHYEKSTKEKTDKIINYYL
jgi:glyoxylase-like metal-dependent hydrolase (beta-lactamase superfamily II)